MRFCRHSAFVRQHIIRHSHNVRVLFFTSLFLTFENSCTRNSFHAQLHLTATIVIYRPFITRQADNTHLLLPMMFPNRAPSFNPYTPKNRYRDGHGVEAFLLAFSNFLGTYPLISTQNALNYFFIRRLRSINIQTSLLWRIVSVCAVPVILYCSPIIISGLLNLTAN